MASRWPSVILAAFTAAGGYIAGDWVSVQKHNANLEKALDNAKVSLARAVEAERRMANLEHQLAQEKDKFNNAVDSSNLADCRVPDPVAGMLDELAEKAANPRMPSTEVP